jgi:Na+/proline symporter
MIFVALIVLVLGMFNPPQIFWVMYMGGAIIASSWMPVALASVLSRKITKAGAFSGMLVGFVVCFLMKLIGTLANITYPVFLDPTFVGIICNIIAMIIASSLTNVTLEEESIRKQMFIIPETENNIDDIRITRKYLYATICLGILIALILSTIWAIPVIKIIQVYTF